MAKQESISMLHQAVECLKSGDKPGFRRLLDAVQQNCADDSLLGEALLLRFISGELLTHDAPAALIRAGELIGNGSRILPPESLAAENVCSAHLLWGNDPIAACLKNDPRLAAIFRRLTGLGPGVSGIHQAQLAFYQGKFDEALPWINAETPRGANGEASVMKVCQLELQAGIARHTRNHSLWRSSRSAIRALASGQQPASRACVELSGVSCALLDMSLGYLQEIPEWIRRGSFGLIPTPEGAEIIEDRLLFSVLPGAMAAHTEYLSYSGSPAKALQYSEMLRHAFGEHNGVLSAYVSLLRAGCYLNLKKPEYARHEIRAAMKIIAQDELWLLVAEFVPSIGDLLYSAAEEFAPDAPEKIRAIAENYSEKLEPLRNELMRGSSEGLTKREQEVMNLAMQGYSNAEIAEQIKVSVRTVRFHLENVYSKLNISRRSKFVSDIEFGSGQQFPSWAKK